MSELLSITKGTAIGGDLVKKGDSNRWGLINAFSLSYIVVIKVLNAVKILRLLSL